MAEEIHLRVPAQEVVPEEQEVKERKIITIGTNVLVPIVMKMETVQDKIVV